MDTAASIDDPIDATLAASTLLTRLRLARLYARLSTVGPATVAELDEVVDVTLATVYEDVDRLEELGAVEAIDGTYPRRYRPVSIDLTVERAGERRDVTPALIVAAARRAGDERLASYRGREGVADLAVALAYARRDGSARSAAEALARDRGQSVHEAEAVVRALRDVLEECGDDTGTGESEPSDHPRRGGRGKRPRRGTRGSGVSIGRGSRRRDDEL